MQPTLRARLAAVTAVMTIVLTAAFVAPIYGSPGSAPPQDGATPTVALLRRLIALDTSHPLGSRDRSYSARTLALATFLKSQVEPLGARVTIYTRPEDGATHFIARLRGDGTKRPILLAAHADVVPVDRAAWTTDPFVAFEKDGFVYGRGALDYKGGLAVFTRAFMMLAQERVPLSRDVILLAQDDEEEGDFDTDWLARHHWSDIDAEFALNEGGWILQDDRGEARQVNITVADNVAVNFLLTARGTPTHSSRPLPARDTAIGHLAPALARLVAHDFEPRLTPHTRAMFAALAKSSQGPLATALQDLLRATSPTSRAEAGRRVVEHSPYPLLMKALMRDTMAVTVLEAGVKRNVIPGLAQANVNVRMLPGTTTDDVIARLRQVVAEPRIEIAIDSKRPDARAWFLTRTHAPPSSTETTLYRALARHARACWPRAEVVAAQFEAGTDAGPWRERGVPVYGIYPYPVDSETLSRMHGNDERVGGAALEQGTAWIYRVLRDVAGR